MSLQDKNAPQSDPEGLYLRHFDPDQRIAVMNDAADYGGHVINPQTVYAVAPSQLEAGYQPDLFSAPVLTERERLLEERAVAMAALAEARGHLAGADGSDAIRASQRAVTAALNTSARNKKLGTLNDGKFHYK